MRICPGLANYELLLVSRNCMTKKCNGEIDNLGPVSSLPNVNESLDSLVMIFVELYPAMCD